MWDWIIIVCTGLLYTRVKPEGYTGYMVTHPPLSNNDKLNTFDSVLLQELAGQNRGNMVISTANIKTILALLLEGAQGETYNQLRQMMQLPDNDAELQQVLYKFQAYLYNDNTQVVMRTANRVFLSQDLSANPNYQKRIQDYYHADITRENFAMPDITARNINSWVNYYTQGLIPNLVSSATIKPEAHLILASAIYFRGDWQEEFDPSRTNVDCFYPTPDECKKTDMMNTVNVFNYTYFVRLDAQAIQLPYQGQRYSMIVILPARKDAITHLGRDIVQTPIKDIVRAMNEREVIVKLPRFTIDYNIDLVPALSKLQAGDVFSDRANLTGILDGGTNSKVNAILHSAKIEVNEKGSTAGAGSAISVEPLMGTKYVPQFIADHPFFFYIYDELNDIVLFSGKLIDTENITSETNQVEIETLMNPVAKQPTIIASAPQSKPIPASAYDRPSQQSDFAQQAYNYSRDRVITFH